MVTALEGLCVKIVQNHLLWSQEHLSGACGPQRSGGRTVSAAPKGQKKALLLAIFVAVPVVVAKRLSNISSVEGAGTLFQRTMTGMKYMIPILALTHYTKFQVY